MPWEPGWYSSRLTASSLALRASTQQDQVDGDDLYGRTKFLGELHESHCLTLRTSTVGLELSHKHGLVEWYLAQRGPIKGFRRAIYSGLTTRELAKAIEHFLVREPELSGLWHLSSEPITKYDLLTRLGDRLGRGDIELRPDDAFVCDRSLDSSKLQARTAYRTPSWNVMLDSLAADINERKVPRDF